MTAALQVEEARAGTAAGGPETVVARFQQRYGIPPAFVVRAPGRVNVIGEHTDYNDGFVLPMAIRQAAWIAARPVDGNQVRLYSAMHDETAEIDLDRLDPEPGSWRSMATGIAAGLCDAGHRLQGWIGVSDSTLPLGAGLSSSAAFELALARTFMEAAGLTWHARAMAKLAHRVECEWIGVQCGIMDPMISALGREKRALLLDCKTQHSRLIPLIPGTCFVILDTGTRRELAGSAYNDRRRQCEQAARALGLASLRDATVSMVAGLDDDTLLRRARHVVTENARTLAAADAMAAGDVSMLGELMGQSHASLRDDFEVSSPALDAMVTIACDTPGCYGARMTGAGFGGCAVALVEEARADTIAEAITLRYRRETGHTPWIGISQASAGAGVVWRHPATSSLPCL